MSILLRAAALTLPLVIALWAHFGATPSLIAPPASSWSIVPGPGLRGLTSPPPGASAPVCGAPIRIAAALPDPAERPDHAHEWLALSHDGPHWLELRDWVLRTRHRRLVLGEQLLGPGQLLVLGGPQGAAELGSVRLTNRVGQVELVDPCGVVISRLAWGGECPRPPEGWVVEAGGDGPGAYRRLGPTRSVSGGAVGGCGQT